MALILALPLLAAACVRAQAGPRTSRAAVLPSSGSQVPSGSLVFDSDRTGNFEIYTLALSTSAVGRLTTNTTYDSWSGRISPDRSHILFYRSPKGVHDRDASKVSLWVMNADGSGQTLLLAAGAYGWGVQGHAEWSKDGAHLVMFAGASWSPQIVVTDPDGANPRFVTSRGGTNTDPSWSPDATIVFIGCPSSICYTYQHELYTTPSAGLGAVTRLTSDSLGDYDPYYSPDGTQLAWLTQTSTSGTYGAWNIRGAAADGSGLHMITNDANINSRPEWSKDGSTIYFHRFVYNASTSFQIYAINPDGTNLRIVTAGQPGNNEYPSA